MIKVGTICIGQNHVNSPECNSMECEVIEALAARRIMFLITGQVVVKACYVVRWADGEVLATSPENIRPKLLPPYAGTGLASILNLFKGPHETRAEPTKEIP